MKNFYVYEHPKYGQKIEKDGFSFLGFFFTIIWLLVKRLYIPALAFFLVFFVAAFADKVITELMGSKIEKIVSLPQNELNEIDRYKEIYWQEIEPANKDLPVEDKLELATIAYATEQVKQLELTGIGIWLVVVAFQFLVGFKGRAWVLTNLEKRGFDLVEKVQAHTKDAVLAELAKRNNDKVVGNTAAGE